MRSVPQSHKKSFVRCCVLICLLSCGGSSDDAGDGAETQRCERLRDHLVDVQLSDINPAIGVDREAHRRAMTQALGDDFIAGCTSKLSEAQVDCAINAADSAAVAACNDTTR
jgi:hypothetical protein